MIDKNTRQVNILFTSAGRRTYIIHYFQQALQGKGKVYASNSIYTYTLGQADGHTLTPEIYNPDYIPFLLQYCKECLYEAEKNCQTLLGGEGEKE